MLKKWFTNTHCEAFFFLKNKYERVAKASTRRIFVGEYKCRVRNHDMHLLSISICGTHV